MKTIKKTSIKHVLLALFCGLLLVLPIITSSNYLRMMYVLVFINTIAVLGINFITGLTGQVNLGMAGIVSLGSYASTIVTKELGVSPWLGLLAAILVGVVIGLALGYPSLRVKGVYLALTTIGFTMITNLILTNTIPVIGGAQGIQDIPNFSIFGVAFDTSFKMYYLYLAIAVVLVIVAHRIVTSKWGRVFKSIKDNPEASEASGISLTQIKLLAFILTSVYGCIAGSLYAHCYTYINPTSASFESSTNYLIMMMIGGAGSVPGSILGTILVTLVPEILRVFERYYWIVFSTVALLTAVFMPKGLISLFRLPTTSLAKNSKAERKNL